LSKDLSGVRVLVVDDDPEVTQMVANYLTEYNMRVVSASGRKEMERLLVESKPHLMILDLRLGKDNGLDLVRDTRLRSDVPIIIITGFGLDEIDRVIGLELGADDYLTKPFSLRELLSRIRAVLRRSPSAPEDTSPNANRRRCQFGGWQLNLRNRSLSNPNGTTISLTKSEYALLNAFVDSPLRPLSRAALQQATRIHDNLSERSIDAQVQRLRRKLHIDPCAPQIIQTERGVGYIFVLPVEWF
jgi:two-component system OmpR family response regulator